MGSQTQPQSLNSKKQESPETNKKPITMRAVIIGPHFKIINHYFLCVPGGVFISSQKVRKSAVSPPATVREN